MKNNYLLGGALMTILLLAVSCHKEIPSQLENKEIYSVRLALKNPVPISTTSMRWCVERPNDNHPDQLQLSWDETENMRIDLFLFQQDNNEDWNKDPNKYVVATSIITPGSDAIVNENGKKHIDFTKVPMNVNFSGKNFDSNKKLKYVLVAGNRNFWFGVTPSIITAPPSGNNGQLGHMAAWTPVREIDHPSKTNGILDLHDDLEWATAVLAVKFDVAPQFADYKFDVSGSGISFRLQTVKNFPRALDPILRTPQTAYKKKFKGGKVIWTPIPEINYYAFGITTHGATPKILDFTDNLGYRYFAIPAEVAGSGIDLAGAKLQWSDALSYPQLTYGGKSFGNGDVIGTLPANMHIEPGKCYGITIRVKDAGNGTPVFVME